MESSQKCLGNTVLKLVLLLLGDSIVQNWVINPSQMPVLGSALLIWFNKYPLSICCELGAGLEEEEESSDY